ncbi:ATP-binding protein [Chitinimonas sp. BJYL2]|uniref:sensor histidine kinase n=1 Tax=Chitinimonas sp. BJYL2 TaxID=2976696 RepID=UPI0022B3DCAA|nr:ATP-binding protein [Chitinimonas sp. BJYL2]
MAMPTVLYLEDNPLDSQLVINALARLGLDIDLHHVDTIAAGQQALSKQRFDLVISDRNVPDGDGLALLAATRLVLPEVPFLFFSGQADVVSVQTALAAGATDYIDKRDLWRLKHAVRQWLDRVPANVDGTHWHWLMRCQSRLVEVVKQLSMARKLDDVTTLVRKVARELVLADGASFVIAEGEQCFYADEDAISQLWKGRRFPKEACISGWAMDHRRQVVIPDIRADARIPLDVYLPTFVYSMVMTPVRQQDPIAAIGVYWAYPYTPSADETALLQSLADATALALENLHCYGELDSRVRAQTLRLENMHQELEAVSYSVSHDLRAPLRAINGFGNILLEDHMAALPDDGRHYLVRICAEAARMDEQIDDLLRLFKLSNQGVERELLDLADLARQACARLQNREPDRNVEIRIAPSLPVEADRGLLSALIESLISNAWKYSARQDAACIEVGTEPDETGSPVYYVRDNGAGFDLQHARKLFAPFQRFHGNKEFPGNGIGLAIVQRVVHQHGGRVWAESAPNAGACFYFTLPAVTA